MNIAVDMRMSGKSGIGTFLDEVICILTSNAHNSFLLFGLNEKSGLIPLLKNKPNVRFLQCDVKMFSLGETFFFPKKILKKINECDIYFSPYCNIPSGIKIPVVSTIHDIVFLDVAGLASWIGKLARSFFYKTCIKRSCRILTVSNFSKERIQKKLHCKKDIKVVYNGVPRYILEDNAKPASKDESIIYIGNIKKHKGLKTLLLAYPQFAKKFPKEKIPKLVIVGSKENFRTSDAKTSRLMEESSKNSSDIVFTGYISDDDLKTLLSRAKVLVQPSLYEGFGIPPLEALYAGTKALVSDIPVFKEIYKDFPVRFFKAGDSESLCNELFSLWNDETPLPAIPEVYSYEKTAALIEESFKELKNCNFLG